MAVSGRRPERSLKETVGRSSAEDGENFCQPCGSDGDWIVAIGYCVNCNEYQCATCLKVHRKQAMSRNHKILEGENMPKAQECSVTLNACSDLCVKHKNEIIKFFCSAHDSVGCGDCMVLDHKVCKIDRIQDISASYFNGAEHKKLQRTVHKFLNDLEEVNKDIKTNEKAAKETYIKAVNDIKAFKNDEELISKLDEETETIQDEVQKLLEKLQLHVSQANEMFVTAKQVKARLASIDDNIKHFQQNSHIDLYGFIPSEDISDIIVSQSTLGEINLTKKIVYEEKKNAGMGTVQQKSILEMEPNFDGEIEINAPDDTSQCKIFDCALISPSRIILADGSNKCVKLANIEDRYLSAKHKFKCNPRGLAVISQNCVAVALPDEKKVQFLTITKGDKLIEEHFLTLKENSYTIAHTNDKLMVLYIDHIEILSLDGKLDRRIAFPRCSVADMAIAPDSMSFYVSYRRLGEVTGFVSKYDFDGKRIATVQYSSQLRGLFVTRDGTVLVCGWKSDGSIHMISPEFKKIREILKQSEQVNYPFSVSFCDDTKFLFICNNEYGLSHNLRNYLKIFRLK